MSGKGRFDKEGIKWQAQEAKKKRTHYGTLQELDNNVGWIETTDKEATWMRWEEPIDGLRYLISTDQMTGESQNGGIDPDNHGAKVWRHGFTDVTGRWFPPEIVASLMLFKNGDKVGNWWDIDILTDEVYKMSRLYGGCVIVPEVNMDRGMIEILKTKRANIYKRQVFNKRKNEYMESYGWHTSTSTRQMMIDNMAKAIRESRKREIGEGVVINCPHTIDELKNFVRKESGREEAADGKHDDQVFAAMIGLQTISFATTYRAPEMMTRLARGFGANNSSSKKNGGFGM